MILHYSENGLIKMKLNYKGKIFECLFEKEEHFKEFLKNIS